MKKVLLGTVLLISMQSFADANSICTKKYSDDVGPGYLSVDDSLGVAKGDRVTISLADLNQDTKATMTRGLIKASISSTSSANGNTGVVLAQFDLSENGQGNLKYSTGSLMYQNGVLNQVSLSGTDNQSMLHQADYDCKVAN